MNILFDICHPAHVHFFRNIINRLQEKNHRIRIVIRDKEITRQLLMNYGFKFKVASSSSMSKYSRIAELVLHECRLYRQLVQFKPDAILSIGGAFMVHAGKLRRIKTFVFTDTEDAKTANRLTFPFATKIITPSCYQDDLGSKQIRYNGYHELAYLHPNYYTPDPSVLDLLGVKEKEKYVIIRFISWEASHDVGQGGLSEEMKRSMVHEFSKHGKVFITFEKDAPEDLKQYRLNIPLERIHDALSYATMYVGEGATMASECACLGTPSIYVNSRPPLGYLEEQEHKYGLVSGFRSSVGFIEKGMELLSTPHIKREYKERRDRLLNDKIDVTPWVLDFIERCEASSSIGQQ